MVRASTAREDANVGRNASGGFDSKAEDTDGSCLGCNFREALAINHRRGVADRCFCNGDLADQTARHELLPPGDHGEGDDEANKCLYGKLMLGAEVTWGMPRRLNKDDPPKNTCRHRHAHGDESDWRDRLHGEFDQGV